MVDVAVAFSMISALASGVLKLGLLKELGERAGEAKEQYGRFSLAKEDSSEQKRLECLARLQKIRNRATLCKCTRDFQQGVLCLILEQTIIAYEATNPKSLDLVQMTTDQLESAL